MVMVKTIGKSGQIALGKEYSGKHVMVDELEPGVWILKLGQFIPDNERWIHRPEARAAIDAGLKWTTENPPVETDLDELKQRLDL